MKPVISTKYLALNASRAEIYDSLEQIIASRWPPDSIVVEIKQEVTLAADPDSHALGAVVKNTVEDMDLLKDMLEHSEGEE